MTISNNIIDDDFEKIFKDNLYTFILNIKNTQDEKTVEEISEILKQIKNLQKKECDIKFKSELLKLLQINNVFHKKDEKKNKLEDEIIKSIGELHENNLLSLNTFEDKTLDFDIKQIKITIEYISAIISGLEGDIINCIKLLLRNLSNLELTKIKIHMDTLTLKASIYYNEIQKRGNIEFVYLKIIQDINEVKTSFFVFNKQPVQIRFIYYKGEFDITDMAKKMKFNENQIIEILNNSRK